MALTVAPFNHAPVAVNDLYRATEDQTLQVAAKDNEGLFPAQLRGKQGIEGYMARMVKAAQAKHGKKPSDSEAKQPSGSVPNTKPKPGRTFDA